MRGVGHIAGDGDHVGVRGERGAGGFQRVGAARVDHQVPALVREGTGKGEAEAA